jgi:hypothetical protein
LSKAKVGLAYTPTADCCGAVVWGKARSERRWDTINEPGEDMMTIDRVSDLDLEVGVFYGVVTLAGGDKVVYLISDAADGADALAALREHVLTTVVWACWRTARAPQRTCS